MTTSTHQVDRLLRIGGGIIARGDHPELRGTLDWLLRTDRLAPVLPGLYVPPELITDPIIRMRAVGLRYPDAVITHGAAARLTYWPEAPLDQIQLASPVFLRLPRGFLVERRRIPPELIVERRGIRVTKPALTAIDVATVECADAIDNALRSRRTTLDGMYEALRLTPHRPGNVDRRRLLIDSRDKPWSAAERKAHRILRAARIAEWKSNHPVSVAGQEYFIDIAFRGRRLALEVDGRLHEEDEDLFESDRHRQNALVLSGWRVLRFTWAMLRDEPECMIANVRLALRP